MTKYCRRKADGAWFEPSHADDYTEAQAIHDCMTGTASFYFRRVELSISRWLRRLQARRTGEIWEPESAEFDVLTESETREALG